MKSECSYVAKFLDNIRLTFETQTSIQMCEYAYFYSGNLKRHLKTQRKEKSHKNFLVVQISIPAVAKCLDNIRGAFRTQTLPEKNAELSLKLNSSLKNILEGNKFWKTRYIRLINFDFVCHFHLLCY